MLPDYLAKGLRVVFCGTAAGLVSATRGHYYSGPGNEFWATLYESQLIPTPLGPSLDYRVLEFGLGLTDLAKGAAASSDRGLRERYDVPVLLAKIQSYEPEWVAFHGKEAAKAVSKHLGFGREALLGEQPWKIGHSKVFVLPSMSGANRDASRLEGKTRREDWFRELASKVDPGRGEVERNPDAPL